MLALQKASNHRGKCTPNLLPCRINHNGPVDASKRYWNPTKTADGKLTAYFRGRKLHGRVVKIPKGYKGAVVSKTERIVPPEAKQDERGNEEDVEEVEEVDPIEEVRIMEEEASFEDVLLWGHEALPDDLVDPYVRGMEEWIDVAGKIHGYESESEGAEGQ